MEREITPLLNKLKFPSSLSVFIIARLKIESVEKNPFDFRSRGSMINKHDFTYRSDINNKIQMTFVDR